MKYLLPMCLVFFFACNRPAEQIRTRNGPEKAVHLKKEIPIDSITLSATFQPVDLSNARNIGEFFDHRLRFFKIDQPNIKINQTPVNELVLYFIDSTLARMRYTVEEEVGSYLLDSLGMSRFKALDSLSKSLLKERKIYDRRTSRLHPDLKNFELVWRDKASIKRYRVKTFEDSLTTRYYYQEMYGYKAKVKELEAFYYYLENSIPILD